MTDNDDCIETMPYATGLTCLRRMRISKLDFNNKALARKQRRDRRSRSRSRISSMDPTQRRERKRKRIGDACDGGDCVHVNQANVQHSNNPPRPKIQICRNANVSPRLEPTLTPPDLVLPSTSIHSFSVDQCLARAKVNAGMYRSAVKVCIDSLLSGYSEITKLAELIQSIQPCNEGYEQMLESLDSARTCVAGMWCVYAQTLIWIADRLGQTEQAETSTASQQNGAHSKSKNGTALKKRPRRGVVKDAKSYETPEEKGQRNEACGARSIIIRHAVIALGNAAWCPIVGNHPWIAIAISRSIFMSYMTDKNEEHMAAVKRNIRLAIGVCNDGRLKAGASAGDDITRETESLDYNEIVAFLYQHEKIQRQSRTGIKDNVSFGVLRASISKLYSIIPCLQRALSSRFMFRDVGGLCILTYEMNRLRDLEESVSETVSMCLVKGLNYDLTYGFDNGLELMRALMLEKSPKSPAVGSACLVVEKAVSRKGLNTEMAHRSHQMSWVPVTLRDAKERSYLAKQCNGSKCCRSCCRGGTRSWRNLHRHGVYSHVEYVPRNEQHALCPSMWRRKDDGELVGRVDANTCSSLGYTIRQLVDLLDYAIELFEVDEFELQQARGLHMQGVLSTEPRFSPVSPHFVGQVGLRCLFCSKYDHFGASGSFCFPEDRNAVLRDACVLCLEHLDSCVMMPVGARNRYAEYRGRVSFESAEVKEFWMDIYRSMLRSKEEGQGICWKKVSRIS